MASRVRGILEHLLGRRLQAAVCDVVSDAELLQRFVSTRDEAAFELLVWRHGAMVLGLCRRAIRDEQLAEDAFQAVFLVLAQGEFDSARQCWGLAVPRRRGRVAARAARRRLITQPVPELSATALPDQVEVRELGEILDAEVARLPDRLRRVVILCYLGRHTTEDAARELGCPRGTVLSRLAAARKRLAERLTRRGVTLPALGVIVGEGTTGRLVSQTVALAQNPFRIPAASGPAILAESVVRAMTTTKLAMICAGVVLATGLSLGVGWVAAGTDASDQVSAATTVALDAGQPPQKKEAAAKEDRAALLRRQSDEIARRVGQLQARIVEETAVMDGGVEVSVLKDELFGLENLMLMHQDRLKAARKALEAALKRQQETEKLPVDESLVLGKMEVIPEVLEARRRANQAMAVRDSLKSKVAVDNPVYQLAEKEFAAKTAELEAARLAARPHAEESVRESVEMARKETVEEKQVGVRNAENVVSEVSDRRKQLIKRIGEHRVLELRWQFLQDELNALRGIQTEILRIKTLTELGIEPTPALARLELDPRIEAQLKSLKQEIEALRAEVKALRKK